jgi:SAM-dependent methyltransferase
VRVYSRIQNENLGLEIAMETDEFRELNRYAPRTEPKVRPLLRRLHAEHVARELWHAYLAIDRLVSPLTSGDLDYWFPRVRKHLPPAPTAVLDLGGGEAPYRTRLFDKVSQYVVLEVDMCRILKQDGVEYIVGDGTTSLFAESSFDAIVLTQVLEHVPDPFRLVQNCATWLKPNGALFVTVPQYWHVHGWPSDYFRYTKYGLIELVRRVELEVVDIWALGGPCNLVYWVIELNFSKVMRFPVFRQVIAQPMRLLASAMDHVLFKNNESRVNPDTQGWMMVARKPY